MTIGPRSAAARGALFVAAILVTGAAVPGTAAARPRPPVVMVILDELPITSLLGRSGHIDGVRYPGFAALARDATWFSNATTQSDSTKYAIPAVLDGRVPRRGVPATFRGYPNSVFTLLRGRGYRIRAHEEGTTICPYRSCRRRHGARYFLVRRRLARFVDFILSIRRTRRPTFYFKHTLLPHVPWTLLPSGNSYLRTVIGPIPGLNSALSVHDPFLVRQSWQRHLLQVGAVDGLLRGLIYRMKQTGIYDRALLVVMADHGMSFRVGVPDKRTVTYGNIQDIAPIPLFVKAPRQRRGRINRSLVRTSDVLPTMAKILGIPIRWRHGGRPAFARAVRGRRSLKILSRSPKPILRISGARLLGLKKQSLRRRLRLLGSGRRSLFEIGPHRGLIGRAVSSLRVAGRGRLRARIANAGELRNVRPGSGFVPVLIAGRIRGGRNGGTRDLAIAVNGRIRAVGRSFYLRGRRTETFAVMVPESALAPGRNQVEVLTDRTVRRRLRFRRIYGKPFGQSRPPPRPAPSEQPEEPPSSQPPGPVPPLPGPAAALLLSFT